MAEPTNQTSEWFCGTGSSEVHIQAVDYLHDSCLLNGIYCVPHAALILLATTTLVYMRFFYSEVATLYKPGAAGEAPLRLRYPFHDIRWLFLLSLVLLTFFQVWEGVLTDLLVLDEGTHPQLFIPGILALVGAIVSMTFYNYTELWNRPKMLWLQVVYWLASTINETLRFRDLRRIPEVNLATLRYDITLLMLGIYVSFLVMDGYLLLNRVIFCNKLTKSTYGGADYATDALNPNCKYRHHYSNYVSSLSLWWLNSLFKTGYVRPLEVSDLGELPTRFKSQVCVDDFQAEIKNELMNKDSMDINDANFVKIYTSLHGAQSAVAGAQRITGCMLQLTSPLLLQKVIDQITLVYNDEIQPVPKDVGYISVADAVQNVYALIVLLFIINFFAVVLSQRHSQTMFHVSAKVRAALQGSVYLKALQLSPGALNSSDMNTGRVTNLIGTDPTNMQMFFMFIHTIWTAPIQLIVMMYLLYTIVGPSALVGAVSFVVGMLLQGYIAKWISKFQTRVMAHSDNRLKGTNELLQGIKLVKLNGWEQKFQDRIRESRDSEINELYQVAKLSSTMTPLAQITLAVAVVLAYGFFYVIEDKPLTPQILFPALSLFQAMTGPLMILPSAIMFAINAFISHKRLKMFLGAPEVEDKVKGRLSLTMVSAKDTCHSGEHRHDAAMQRLKSAQPSTGESYGTFDDNASMMIAIQEPEKLPYSLAMKIENGSFAWEDPCLPTLTDINIEIQAGKLTAVVGEVGSGKSSLVSALLGEMKTVTGEVVWNSDKNSTAYASQKAWLVNASLKDNIMFGTAFDEERYNRVIEVCGLRQDIDVLPAGDRTEIGEKGINLSGGQKQRVSVARAVYSHADVVILDDPMSALDAHVGSHLFKEALKTFLIEEGRTVVLVTHQTQFLPEVNYVIVMKNGTVVHQGTPDEIKEADPVLYDTWVTAAVATRELAETEVSEKDRGIEKDIQALRDQIKEREKELRFRHASRLSRTSSFLEEEEPFEDNEMREPGTEEDDGSTLIKAEERNRGSVSWRVYYYYINAVGLKAALLVGFLYLGVFVGSAVNNFWLSRWSEVGLTQNLTTTELQDMSRYYLVGYAFLSLALFVITYLANAGTFISSLMAGQRIYKKVLQNITQSPMRFFDTTPIGRILNRFSVDTKMVDQTIGGTLSLLLQFALNTIVGLVLNIIAAPIVILGLVPIGILYCYIMSYYITTTRELKRLESITLSPVYSQFTETISGLSTIRAYNKQACFAGTAMDKINISSITSLFRQGSNFWLQFRLGFVGAAIIMVGGVAVVTTFYVGDLDPSLVAMAMTVSLFSAQQLMQLVTQSAELEMQMNAIERLQYFADISTEKQDGVFDPPDDWPFTGDITVRNIEMRYAIELEPVLQGINLRIKGGEKVGICGRTGSGKSSMMLAFFRLIDKTVGEIYIDGVNIDHVPLAVLRQRLSIVPQDPTLFTGSIRFNLDPFDKCSDNELWEALGIAQLRSTVANLPDGIDSHVTEGGENFSVGQRQLFCLARAFLRKSRILIMDEATASIDKEMDAILQDVLFSAFTDKTVLTIAHRVSTILSYDTIVVLNEGKLAEWDSPKALLSKPDSIFSSLVNKDK